MKKIGLLLVSVLASFSGEIEARVSFKKLSVKTKSLVSQIKKHVATPHKKMAVGISGAGLVVTGSGIVGLAYYVHRQRSKISNTTNGNTIDNKEQRLFLEEESVKSDSSNHSFEDSDAKNEQATIDGSGSIVINSGPNTITKAAPLQNDSQKKDLLDEIWGNVKRNPNGVKPQIENRIGVSQNPRALDEEYQKTLTKHLVQFLTANQVKNPEQYVVVMHCDNAIQKLDDDMTIHFFQRGLTREQANEFVNQFKAWVTTQLRGNSVRVRFYSQKKPKKLKNLNFDHEMSLAFLSESL